MSEQCRKGDTRTSSGLRPSGLPKQSGSMKRRPGSGCQLRVRPPSARAQVNAALDGDGAAIHRKHRGMYGRPRIVRQLRAQGRTASEERVRCSLRRQGLRLVYRRSYRVTPARSAKPTR